jgi:hypothetical protein
MGSRGRVLLDVVLSGAVAGAMLAVYALVAGAVPGLDVGLVVAELSCRGLAIGCRP